jgi:aminodeoxyfutalosine deaminase
MIEVRAAWVLPISAPPLRHGWIAIDRHRIAAVGKGRGGAGLATRTIDLGSCAVLPGLVNAHGHLELAWLRGKIGPRGEFPDWIRTLIALRRDAPPVDVIAAATAAAIDEALRCGTALVGDITNTLGPFDAIRSSALAAVVFDELLGFNSADAPGVVLRARDVVTALPRRDLLRASLAPHAPYSVSPALFRAIRADLDAHPFERTSVHLAESRAELEFLRSGTGPWRALLEELGVWNPAWVPPACGPVAYLERLAFLDGRVLVVHGVHLSDPELRRIARLGATVVTCPRGNIRTGAGEPRIQAFYDAGVRVALGTDSLGSVDDLNVFSEIAAARRLAPRVPARRLLESATRVGAEALGFGGELGAIEPGFRARLVAVDVPADETDVEEYLTRGVEPDRIRWIE